jgi:hypothetical protein
MTINVSFGTDAYAEHGGVQVQMPDDARDNLKDAITDIVTDVSTVIEAEWATSTTVQQIKDALAALLSA